jgi:hypothetical protein
MLNRFAFVAQCCALQSGGDACVRPQGSKIVFLRSKVKADGQVFVKGKLALRIKTPQLGRNERVL